MTIFTEDYEAPPEELPEDELTPEFVRSLIDRCMEFMEVFVGYPLHPYQKPFARRIIESVLINDGETITATAARQSGKSDTIANTVVTLMVLLPRLAKMYPDLLGRFKDGIWVGLFAPVEGQVETLFSRVMTRLTSERAQEILGDPEIDDEASKAGGVVRTIRLKKSGSFVSMMTANPKAKIESRTFHLVVIDECFPAETPVLTTDGWVPIGEIVNGGRRDWIVATQESDGLGWSRVRTGYRTPRHTSLVRVDHEHGSVYATANHPFMVDGQAVPAISLTPGTVLSVVPGSDQPRSHGARQEGRAPVLLQQMSSAVQESDGGRGRASVDVLDPPQDWSPPQGAGGQWSGSDRATAETLGRATQRLGSRACLPHWREDQGRTSDALQDRPGSPGQDDRRGDRRWLPSIAEAAGSGSPQGQVAVQSRVVGVEVLQPGSPEFDQFSDGADYVYTLEVESESHTYIAGGVLVGNCQEADQKIVQKCYAAGTPIWLPDGTIRPVEEVVDQRLPVLTYDTEWDLRELPGGQPKKGQGRKKDTGSLVGTVPVEWIDNGEQPVWTVTLASGRRATVTANHEWVVRERRGNSHPKVRTTDTLEVGMHVPLPRSIDFFGDRLRFDDGYFLGQMLGDGCMSGASPMWCGYPGEAMEEMSQYAASLGTQWRVGKESPDGFQNGAFTKPGNGLNGVTAFLREERVWGHKGRGKRLGRMDYSRDAVRGILSGLIDSDGCVSATNISFANISEELVRQVSDLALKFGAVGYIDKREQNGGFGSDPHPMYEVRWKNRDAVIALAGVLSLREPRKRERLERLVEIKEAKVSRRRVVTEKRRVLDVQWDRIVEIQYAGVQPTYCVTVEPSHLLIVDGFVCRNSISPMLAYHSGTMVMSGTPSSHKGVYYTAIQQNKRRQTGRTSRQHHFQWNWKEVAKVNPNYGKFVKKEMLRIGEDSDEFQISYCPTPETRILTADMRHVPAGEITVGMTLVGFDEERSGKGQHRRFRESVVEDVGRIMRPCYRLTLSDGTSVTCSSEHRWLVTTAGRRTEWKMTKDLVSTDRIFKVTDVWDHTEDYRTGYLAAAFEGEGHFSRHSMLGFSQKDNPMLLKVRKYLEELGFSTWEWNGGGTNADVTALHVGGGRSEVMRFLGQVRPERLLDKVDIDQFGTIGRHYKEPDQFQHPYLLNSEFVGEQEVVAIKTSTKTYIAEGLASHNCCSWILERGMFVTEGVMEQLCDKSMEVVKHWHKSPVVVGIDPARKLDSTVVTVVWVDWDRPDEFGYYDHRVLNWLELTGEDWEKQYAEITDFLANYDVLAVAVDANGVGDAVAQRLKLLLPRAEVIPVTSSMTEQSSRFKHLQALIQRKMIGFPGHSKARRLRTWKRFMQQMIDAERHYQGANFTVKAPEEAWAHDDHVDALAIACSLTKEYVMPTIEVSASPFFG